MQMRTMMLVGAAVLLVGVTGTAPAASITVLTDSGNIGEFTFTNTGVGPGGAATIAVSVPSITSAINTVNGIGVPAEPTVTNTPVTLIVTPTSANTYVLNLPSGDVKTVGATIGA